jgi:uncharacterized protein
MSEYIAKKPSNPFVMTGYWGTEYFCDREQELAIMTNHIMNNRNVVIAGWRRMGKTALIRRIFEDLQKTGNYSCIYADLMVTRTAAEAIRQLAQAVVRQFGEPKAGFGEQLMKVLQQFKATVGFNEQSGAPEISLGYDHQTPEKSAVSLEAIGQLLSSREETVLIALDEFQQVADFSDCNGEALFRNWMQSFPQIRFIFSGSRKSMMEAMFTAKSRPFYRSSQFIVLNPIQQQAYESFIMKHFENAGKSIGKEVTSAIYNWAGHQTYLVQWQCNLLYDRTESAALTDLTTVQQEMLEQEKPYFSGIHTLLTYYQWDVLAAIAKAQPVKNPLAQLFLRTYKLGSSSSVASALKKLTQSELVIKTDNGFELADVLLMHFLKAL